MKIALLIPLKRLSEIKSRLNRVLNEKQRIDFSILMLKDIIKVCLESKVISKIYIISQEYINNFLNEFKEKIEIIINKKNLNEALYDSLEICKKYNYDAFLIIPSDIPLIEKEDIKEIVSLIKEHDIVLSPSCDSGTNAILVKSNVKIKLEYGEERKSFILHLKNSLKSKLKIALFINERIMMDIDDEIRLEYLKSINKNKSSILYLKGMLNEKN